MKQNASIMRSGFFALLACLGFLAVTGVLLRKSIPEGSEQVRSWFATTIHTDCPSGVQYLQGWSGALTPRLDAEGQIMVAEGICDDLAVR